MRHSMLPKLIPLVLGLSFAPLSGALAAGPTVQDEPTAEDSAWLAATTAPKVAFNGRSLNGHNLNGTSLRGRTVRGDGGMTVVSIEVPHGARHEK